MKPATPVRRSLIAEMLADVPGRHRAVICGTEPGVAAGLGHLDAVVAAGDFGNLTLMCSEGQSVAAGMPIAELIGSAGQLAAAEDAVLGPLGFAGGVAARCREVLRSAPDGLRVVCGGWKKLPAPLKPLLRDGLQAGGVAPRLVDGDFVYVDKNVVSLSGGVDAAVTAALRLDNGPVAIQVNDAESALAAARAGAGIVMDDTGSLESLYRVDGALRDNGLRDQVMLAFAGGVAVNDLDEVGRSGADIVDLGRAILNAPLWDVHMVVIE